MNNYSTTQKLLHRIALSSNFFKEIYFDFEKMFFLNEHTKLDGNHVFISGMARSGTTILLNAIYNTKEFASLTYQDMPFVLSPNLWSKLNKGGNALNKQERAHEDGIKINTNSPEAFEEVFWKNFHYDESDTFIEFTNFVQLLCMKYNKHRYLSKNNQNIKRIDYLIKNFPNSKIIIPFREPLQHANSLYNQHKKFISLQKKDDFIRKYMFWIGHSEFGMDYELIFKDNIIHEDSNELNHWLEQWMLFYDKLYYLHSNKQILFICYENLCNENLAWDSIQSFIEIKNEIDFEFIESKKEITLPYEENLYRQCISLYQKLKYLN